MRTKQAPTKHLTHSQNPIDLLKTWCKTQKRIGRLSLAELLTRENAIVTTKIIENNTKFKSSKLYLNLSNEILA